LDELNIYKKGWKKQKQVKKKTIEPCFWALPCQDHMLIHNWRTPNSLQDSKVSPSTKQRKGDELGHAP
jgi:hypothetical protein